MILVSCSAPSEESGVKYVIGVSLANLSEPWRINMGREIEDEARRLGDIRIILTDAADQVERQIGDVERLLGYGVDLLIISPVDSALLTPVVSDVHRKIPVVVLDRGIEGYDYTLFIGPDNYLIGEEAGRLVAETLIPGGGAIVEVIGRSGSPPTEDRSKGFSSEIAKRTGLSVEATVSGDWLRDNAEDQLMDLLTGTKAPDVVVAWNDAMALGAYRALDKLGFNGVRIVGVDGFPGPDGGIELVRGGILSATFVCPTGGREAVRYALSILEREPGLPKQVFLRTRLVTRESIFRSEHNPVSALKGRQIRLGFSQPGTESAWRLANIRSITQAAHTSGINLEMPNAQLDQTAQIEAIRGFILNQKDIIAFSPIVETGWTDVLTEVRDAGIPVIFSDRSIRDIPEGLIHAYIGADFVEEGRRAARWLVSETRDKPAVRIVELSGTIDSAPANGRGTGFREILDTVSGLEIIASESGDFRSSEGRKVMQKMLIQYGSTIDVVYAHNDDMALGAIEAIAAFGLKPGRDIRIISIDATRPALQALASGRLNFIVECNPLLGSQLMKAVRDFMTSGELPLRIIIEEGTFTREAAVRVLSTRMY